MKENDKDERINIVMQKIKKDRSFKMYREEMISCFDIWSDFDYKDWSIVLEKIKNQPLRLYNFFLFISRIIGIEILQEFKRLQDVKEEVLNYVGDGKRISMYSISMNDIRFYTENKKVIDKICSSIDKLKKQGAIPIQSYTLYCRRRNGELFQQYKKNIMRREFTMIELGDICQDKYLYRQSGIMKKG